MLQVLCKFSCSTSSNISLSCAFIFITLTIPLCYSSGAYIMCSLECVFAIDASLHSWLYKLLLSTNYVLKMTPEHRIGGSIILLSLDAKMEAVGVLEKKELMIATGSFDGWLFIVYVVGIVQHGKYSIFHTVSYTGPNILSVWLNLYD